MTFFLSALNRESNILEKYFSTPQPGPNKVQQSYNFLSPSHKGGHVAQARPVIVFYPWPQWLVCGLPYDPGEANQRSSPSFFKQLGCEFKVACAMAPVGRSKLIWKNKTLIKRNINMNDGESFPRRVTIPVVTEATAFLPFWWFDYMYPYIPSFVLLIRIGLTSFATIRFWTNINWCGVCVNNRMIPQGALSYKFRSVGQKQA